jgi:hypothetical protein
LIGPAASGGVVYGPGRGTVPSPVVPGSACVPLPETGTDPSAPPSSVERAPLPAPLPTPLATPALAPLVATTLPLTAPLLSPLLVPAVAIAPALLAPAPPVPAPTPEVAAPVPPAGAPLVEPGGALELLQPKRAQAVQAIIEERRVRIPPYIHDGSLRARPQCHFRIRPHTAEFFNMLASPIFVRLLLGSAWCPLALPAAWPRAPSWQ